MFFSLCFLFLLLDLFSLFFLSGLSLFLASSNKLILWKEELCLILKETYNLSSKSRSFQQWCRYYWCLFVFSWHSSHVWVHAKLLQSCSILCAMLGTVSRQAPLSMGFSRQEYWSGLPSPPPGDLPDPGIKPASLMSPVLAGRFFTTSTPWEAPLFLHMFTFSDCKPEAFVHWSTLERPGFVHNPGAAQSQWWHVDTQLPLLGWVCFT